MQDRQIPSLNVPETLAPWVKSGGWIPRSLIEKAFGQHMLFDPDMDVRKLALEFAIQR